MSLAVDHAGDAGIADEGPGVLVQLHWYLVFGAYRLAGIFTKLFTMTADAGHLPAEAARAQIDSGYHVQLVAGLLDLTPPTGVVPVVPDVRLDR